MTPRARAVLRRFLLLLGSVLLSACVPSPEQRKVLALRRATTDLKCTQLSVAEVGDRLFRVAGCGRSVTYKIICKLTVYSCDLLDEAELAGRRQ